MQENLKNILNNEDTPLPPEKVMKSLQGELSEAESHELEMQLNNSDFDNDAIEGLESINDKKQINFIVEKLNNDLKKRTREKKKRTEKLKLPDQSWMYISTLILLLLIVISFFIIKKLLEN